MIKNKINLLDCTLRDGGYYNNWFFEEELTSFERKPLSIGSNNQNDEAKNINVEFDNQ